MPAKPLSTPERTKSQNLIRFTRMPAKNAASRPAPIAKIERPSGVACRTTPNTTARIAKNRIDHAICVPWIGSTPMFEKGAVKTWIVSVGRIPWAMPRKSVSVPIVTASDGRPSPVTRKPLNAPHRPRDRERGGHRQPDRPAVRERAPPSRRP